jgi:hypothetical protein
MENFFFHLLYNYTTTTIVRFSCKTIQRPGQRRQNISIPYDDTGWPLTRSANQLLDERKGIHPLPSSAPFKPFD